MLRKILTAVALTFACISCSTDNVMQHSLLSQKLETAEQLNIVAFKQKMQAIVPLINAKVNKDAQLVNLSRHFAKLPLKRTDTTKCDQIILKNGDEIKGKVSVVSANNITYKKCENLNGPDYRIKKSEIAVINYSNGTNEKFPDATDQQQTTQSRPTNNETTGSEEKKVEGLGLAGFICSIVGIFVIGFILGALGVIFGAISLHRFNKYPGKYKGKGFAIVSLILGLIAVVVSILFLIAGLAAL